MRLKGIWLVLVVPFWALVGCASTGPVRYEEDPGHYPYYKPMSSDGEVGFFPRTYPGVVVGGPHNGSIVHNGRVYNEDGSMEYLRR